MAERNPFHVPADEEVFALRDEEAARKRIEREEAKELKVWEKGVKKNKSAAMLAGEDLDGSSGLHQSKLNLVAQATRDRRKEKEHMGEFIAKKREMFLVQMSLDTKRAEIRKLEERAQQREEVRSRPAASAAARGTHAVVGSLPLAVLHCGPHSAADRWLLTESACRRHSLLCPGCAPAGHPPLACTCHGHHG